MLQPTFLISLAFFFCNTLSITRRVYCKAAYQTRHTKNQTIVTLSLEWQYNGIQQHVSKVSEVREFRVNSLPQDHLIIIT